MTSAGSRPPESIAAVVQRLKLGAEAAAKAREDPELQAKAREEYADRIVDLPEVRRAHLERAWRERDIPERLWPMLHDGAPPPPGAPPECAACGPLAPKPTPALEAVRRFLAPSETKTFLVLGGPVDTGKTVAAAWGVAWHGGRFAKAMDLLRAGLYPEDTKFWPRLHGEKLLVVDDLGTEPLDPKGFGLAAIANLVDVRYDDARRTIITTNLSPGTFRDRFGDRIWRRIEQAGLFVGLKPLSGRRFFGQPGTD